jgi:hypothetical protein
MTKRLSFLLALVLVCTMSGLAMAKATITHFHYSGHGQAWGVSRHWGMQKVYRMYHSPKQVEGGASG